MSSDIAIKVEHLSKRYEIYDHPHDRLKQFLLPRIQRLCKRPIRQYFQEFWALNNVSFEIKKGETVGIIGRNGSGKSTLLQMVCGTLNPTGGTIETHGRIAALLELGSGFNPEFSGRENVYMNASILGLKKEEIDARFDEIATFADIGQFIEQPVKMYSSGMMVRLAFAVAINVDPEILIVDEALSVGDELFQRKCFAKIESIKEKGATILFVSHSGSTIVELCDHAILLDAGEKISSGNPKDIVNAYQKLLYAPVDKKIFIRETIIHQMAEVKESENSAPRKDTNVFKRNDITLNNDDYDPNLRPTSTVYYESQGAIIKNAAVYNSQNIRVNILSGGKTYKYQYTVKFLKDSYNIRFGMLIKATTGLEIGGAEYPSRFDDALPFAQKGDEITVDFLFNTYLTAGIYFMNAGVLGNINNENSYLHRVIDIAAFRIVQNQETCATAIVDFSCTANLANLNQ